MINLRSVPLALLASGLISSLASAQGADPSFGSSSGTLIDSILNFLATYGLWIGLAVVVGVLLSFAATLLMRQNSRPDVELLLNDAGLRSTRFEQLFAEIQGLSLRVRSGESKGYYRKIEQLVRVFLERTGHPGARKMEDADVRKILEKGQLPKDQSDTLLTIFNRCKQGAEHESDKLDFTAAELLRTLYGVVEAADTETVRKPA
jgi:hypothetical protein